MLLSGLFACATRDASPPKGERIEPAALPALVVHDAAPPPPREARFEPRETRPGVTQIGPYEYRIERRTIDALLENSADIMPNVRVVPDPQGGSAFRLFFTRPDAMPAAFGIRSGDAIVTVNELDLSTPERTLEAYARFRDATLLRVVVRRDDTVRTLVYHVE